MHFQMPYSFSPLTLLVDWQNVMTFAYYRSWSVAPNSPDLNSSEDKICSITSIRQHVYETSINNIDKLKQQLTEVWSRLQQNIVDAATGKCRKRLQACVCTQWKHFEHLLYDYRKFSLSSRLNVFINVRLTKWVSEWRENVSQRALNSLTVLSEIPSLVSSSHHADV